MELDLNSFLDSQLSSDDDDGGDLTSIPHRTIDEILNDSDSSASSSPPPSPPRRSSYDAVSVSASRLSSESSIDEARRSPQLEERPVGSRTSSSARFKSAGEPSSSPEDLFRRASKPLPSLFGGVRSNAKPGAALAAAAAASRSVPSPHAAAIKSRRSLGSSEGLRKVLDGRALGSTLGDDSEAASDELPSNSNGDLKIISSDSQDSNGDEITDGLRTVVADIGSEVLSRDRVSESSLEGDEVLNKAKDNESRVDNTGEGLLDADIEPQIDSTLVNSGKDVDFQKTSAVTFVDDVETSNLESKSDSAEENGLDERSKFLDVNDDNENGCCSSLPNTDNNGKMGEELTSVELETEDSLEKFASSNDINEDLTGDNAGSTSDIDELVEERIGQLESRRISERPEKKMRSRLKPLELAEELEKKQASTGLHWEEGAAAQPMRLEGVRRGSTTLGYFDVAANNTITRTISSQAFRRDYGSPQTLAVHANYIAVGMARGVIVVVPSKYSAHNADEMDAKVSFSYFSYIFSNLCFFDAFALSVSCSS